MSESDSGDKHAECCSPVVDRGAMSLGLPVVDNMSNRGVSVGGHKIEQCVVAAGAFVMGDSYGDGRAEDGECHQHEVHLDGFSIDATTVSNKDFATFIDATGYTTEAQVFGDSAVFHLAVQADREHILGRVPGIPWWLSVRGADWAHPNGPGSSIDGFDDHPVTHVSWNDAQAYCAWAGRRLPTEAEWEKASRGGLDQARFPWGDELLRKGGAWQCNIWQGDFPSANSRDDGWLTTAPVRSYAPNGLGLWQTVGNVWEWCADYFEADYYRHSPRVNPRGPATGDGYVLRGGSYLCHDSYCNRYRNAARSRNTPDSTMGNAGFRTVGI